MPLMVVKGATLQCSQGVATSKLSVSRPFDGDEQAIATVDDYKPNTNIAPFGKCRSMSNPSVASASAAAGGALTPMDCVPVVTARWSPGSRVTDVDDVRALTSNSTCNCSYAGRISITDANSAIETD
jgi:hypothetical protein